MLTPSLDCHRLTRETFVDQVEYLASVSSTNDYLRQRAPRGGTVLVVADEQTAGRGRGSNRWWTGAGSLALSLLYDPRARGIERRYAAMVALGAALSVVEAITPLLTGRRVGLHWPNDVFVDDRKIAGILVETTADGRQIVGLGCNVNNSLATAPADVADVATSLIDLTDQAVDRTELILRVLQSLDGWLDQLAAAPAQVGRRADAVCLQLGRLLTLELGEFQARGTCLGIADDGGLRLNTPTGERVFYSGVLLKA